MARIQSTSDPAGASPYEVPYNPAEIDAQDFYNAETVPVLHGAAALQRKAWDDRPRVLRWFAVGVTSTVDPTGRTQMLDTMRGWIGTVRYFNFQNLDRVFDSWPTSDTWKKCRIIDVKTELRRGGELRYDSVELWIQPSQ